LGRLSDQSDYNECQRGNLDFEHPRDRTVTRINAPQDIVIVFMKNYSQTFRGEVTGSDTMRMSVLSSSVRHDGVSLRKVPLWDTETN
jgi:hypothetical protein